VPASPLLLAGNSSPAAVNPTPALAPAAASAPLWDICAPVNDAYCWTEHSDSPFYMFLNTSRAESELYYWLDTGECGGGHVTSTCPFADTAMDEALVGHDIAMFQFYYSGLCMAARSDTDMDSAACSAGTNEAFVPIAGGSTFISVGASNLVHGDEYVCPDIVQGGYNEPIQWNDADICDEYGVQEWVFKNG
jgi:hypothetical protein